MRKGGVTQVLLVSCVELYALAFLLSQAADADFIAAPVVTPIALDLPQTNVMSPYNSLPVAPGVSTTIFCQTSDSLLVGTAMQQPVWGWIKQEESLLGDSNELGGEYKADYVNLMNCAVGAGCVLGSLSSCGACGAEYSATQTSWAAYISAWSLLAQHQNLRPGCKQANDVFFNRSEESWVDYGVDLTNTVQPPVEIFQPKMQARIVPPMPL